MVEIKTITNLSKKSVYVLYVSKPYYHRKSTTNVHIGMGTTTRLQLDYNYTNALKRNDDFFRNRPISHMGVMGIGRVHKLR